MSENEKATANDTQAADNETAVLEEAKTDNADALASDYSYSESKDKKAEAKPLPPENVLLGTIGAFLFSLIGAILFFVIYQSGRVAVICGFVTVVCAIKGYSIFGKRETVRGIIIATVISFITIVIAEFLSFSFLLYDNGWLTARVDYEIPFYAIPAEALDFLMTNTDFLPDLLIEYALVIAMSALGAFTQIKNALSAAKLNSSKQK